jgi:hypothetical protein
MTITSPTPTVSNARFCGEMYRSAPTRALMHISRTPTPD